MSKCQCSLKKAMPKLSPSKLSLLFLHENESHQVFRRHISLRESTSIFIELLVRLDLLQLSCVEVLRVVVVVVFPGRRTCDRINKIIDEKRIRLSLLL